MRTALVTGAAGFTGRYVVSALTQRGFRVFGTGLGPASAPDWVPCDLTSKADTYKMVSHVLPDIVVHLAALTFVPEGKPEDFYRVNVFGTLNLLSALAANQKAPSKVLIASSANVYGNTSGELTEDTCPAPVNHYAASKLAMEYMAKTWFDRLPIVITRPFNYTGPGQEDRFIIPKIVGHFKRHESRIKLGDISVERDFSDVDDIVEAYLLLLESGVHSQIVNVCRGETISVARILELMGAIASYRIDVETDPALFRENDIKRLVGSDRKLRALVGFAPGKPIQETLQRMYFA